jgi:predicted RNase H-like nuclease (RuvC/YqgF family)
LPDGLLHQQRERLEREMKRLLIEHEARINREWNKRLGNALAEKEERIRELEGRFNGQNDR